MLPHDTRLICPSSRHIILKVCSASCAAMNAALGKIAGFIASLDVRIPYALLAFAPNFYFHDLPCTSAEHARDAEAAARAAGLLNVRIGNRHLLGLGWE